MSRNKKWSPSLKFEIALLALKNETTLNEICKRYEVAPSQIHAWKKQLLSRQVESFNKGTRPMHAKIQHKPFNRGNLVSLVVT